MGFWRVLVLAAALLSACANGRKGNPQAGPAGPVDAGPPAPELSLVLETPEPDGGTEERPLRPGQPLTVDPTGRLGLRATVALRNYRVRIFDEADRALESNDRADDGPDGMRYSVELLSPLRPGHRYALVVDPRVGTSLADAQGHVFPEQRFELQTSGERERDPPRPVQKPKRHRRRR